MRLALLLVLAACGDTTNNHHIVDSPLSGDAPVDGPGSMVTVTMKDTAGPMVNTKVYFQGTDSSVIATIGTDANGVAAAPMPNGGFVTVVDPDITIGAVRTWAGVKNGDALVYDTSTTPDMSSTVSFTIPRVSGQVPVTYGISTPCGSISNVAAPVGAAALPFPVAVGLTCGPTVDVLVTATDSNQRLVSSFYVPDQPITSGTVDFSASTYVAAGTRSFTFNNNTSLRSWTVGDDFEVPAGAFFSGTGTSTAANPSTLTIVEPALPANTLDVLVLRQVSGTTARSIESWGPTGGTVAMDVSTMLLPDFAGAPAFDVASHTIMWTQTANSATADFAAALVTTTRGQTRFSWELITPTTTAVVFPVLVDDAAKYNILATDVVTARPILVKYPGGWDAIRPTFYKSSVGPTGASGTILLSSYQVQAN